MAYVISARLRFTSEIDKSYNTDELSNFLGSLLTLQFNQTRQIIYQKGQRGIGRRLFGPTVIQYDEETERITEVSILDQESQMSHSTYRYMYAR